MIEANSGKAGSYIVMTQPTSGPTWHFRVGATLLVASFLAPALIPVVLASDLPTNMKAALSGLLVAGLPEVGMLAAVSIMGRNGLARLGAMLGRAFAPIAPPDRVSPGRHKLGLVLFVSPLVLGWMTPYFRHHLPGHEQHPLVYAIAGDVMFLVSLFVLGGEFWDKLRALFDREARVITSAPGSAIDSGRG